MTPVMRDHDIVHSGVTLVQLRVPAAGVASIVQREALEAVSPTTANFGVLR